MIRSFIGYDPELVGAFCAQPESLNPNWWHSMSKNDTDTAISFCLQDCPVTDACLRKARERGETMGVWGGIDFGKR